MNGESAVRTTRLLAPREGQEGCDRGEQCEAPERQRSPAWPDPTAGRGTPERKSNGLTFRNVRPFSLLITSETINLFFLHE
jgi:hypothetical protein